MNKVILTGRLVADPEFSQTQSGIACCRFRVAVNRPYKKDADQTADFIDCICWRSTAEFVSIYFSKGKPICIDNGRIQQVCWTDNEGHSRSKLQVLAESVEFTIQDKSSDNTQAHTNAAENAVQSVSEASTQNDRPMTIDQIGEFEEILSDGETPF